MNAAAIRSLVDEVLRRHFGRYGYEGADLKIGLDHTNEPAIQITARFGPDAEPVSGSVSGDAVLDLVTRLRAEGEDRFPYVTHEYAEPDMEEEPATSGLRW